MNCIKVGDTVINLENVTRIAFVKNDVSTTSDDRCRVHFVGKTEPLTFRGSSAKEVFEVLESAMMGR